MSIEWTDVHDEEVVTICKFDDGLSNHANIYPNTWIIIAKWKGKIKLQHTHSDIIINSISAWKVIHKLVPALSVNVLPQ